MLCSHVVSADEDNLSDIASGALDVGNLVPIDKSVPVSHGSGTASTTSATEHGDISLVLVSQKQQSEVCICRVSGLFKGKQNG